MANVEQEKKEKICVIVRVRPLSRDEATSRSPWKLSSKSIASNKTCRPSIPAHAYTFDRIYGTKTPTLDIFNAQVKDIIATTMSGLNGTVIAYGQSRSGKTYTLRGSTEEVGILMLAVQDVFQIVHEASNREFLIRMSYMEVVNGELNDLLAPKSQKVDIREDAELGVIITGLREEIVDKSEQVISLLDFAEARRAVDSTDATNCGVSHTVFRLLIESSSQDRKNDPFATHQRDGYQISVLNLVEVAPATVNGKKIDKSSEEAVQHDKCLMALQTVMSKLCEDGAKGGGCVPYVDSRLTQILRPSLGGNARTCFICNISPAMVHLDETIEALDFAAKTTKVINCFKVNEVYTEKALLKRQRKEILALRNKLKELHSLDLEEEILNRRNALLMIDLEKEQMSLETFVKTPSSSQGENKEQDQEQKAENITFEGESGFDRCFDLPLVDFSDPIQKRSGTDHLGYFSPAQGMKELDLDLQMNCSGLCLGPSVGTKRKRRSNPTAVADKVDLSFQSKAARDVRTLKLGGLTDRRIATEMQTFSAQESKEHQELQTQVHEHCRNLQHKIAELEAEKAHLEKRLYEQEVSHNKELDALKCELVMEKSRQNKAEVAHKGVLETHVASDLEVQQDIWKDKPWDCEETAVKQNTEAQSCTSQEMEDQQKLTKQKASQSIPTKKMPSKVNKVFQKFHSVQGRSELPNLRKELAVAKETITDLEDERNGLWKDLNQMKSKCKEIQSKLEANNVEEDNKGEHGFHHLLAAAVDTLKAEVESTASIIDGLLALLLESYQILAADLKSFQEGVAEIKVLNGATGDVSESLEYANTQLLALRHEKLASDKELNSMKSELAKLECVVERQSGVLKVLSDNENLLNELASVRAAMKEAAGASELQMSSIQQEYEGRLKELESDYNHWRQEYMQLVEEQSKLQDKLSTTEAEVIRLTQALDEKPKQDKRPAKTIKARLAEAEAELVLLNGQLKEKSLAEDEQMKAEQELADSRSEIEKLKREVGDKSRLEEEYIQALTTLAKSEAVVAKMTTACEEHTQMDLEQKNVLLKLEAEVVNLTKSLDEKSRVEEQQKKIQTDLAALQEKIDNLTEEAQQKDLLEKKQCELLFRLDASEKEVTRLTESLKSSQEQSERSLEEMLEKFRIYEAEIVTLSVSLQREVEERQRLEEEHSKDVKGIDKLEGENMRLAGSLKQVLQEKEVLEEEQRKDSDILARFEAEIKELTLSLTSVTEMNQVLENELKTTVAALAKSETEVERLADGLHQELGLRERLEKQHKENHNDIVNLEAKVKELTETLQRVMQEKGNVEVEHRRDLEVIAASEIEIRSMVENLEQCLEEKVSLERDLRKALGKVASSGAKVAKLTAKLEKEKKGTKTLEEELKKGLDDHTNSESRVTWLIEQLDEGVEEKKQLERKLEEISAKLTSVESDVANMTESLTQVTHEKGLVEKNHNEMLETCSQLKLEIANLSESMTREIVIREKLERETSGSFEESSRQTNIKSHNGKKLNSLGQEIDICVDGARTLQDEVAHLKKILARELERREKLENDHAQALHQLSVSRTEAASLSESLIKGVEDNRTLMTDHSHTLSRLSTLETDIVSLSDMLEERTCLEEELRNIQLVHAGTEAEILRLNKELIVKGSLEEELRRTQHELAEAAKEVRKLGDEKWRLEKEQLEELDRSNSPNFEGLQLTDHLTERTPVLEELEVVRSELTESKAELAIMRNSLREKLGLEEAMIRTQMELVDKQGECEKLSKDLRINRKMVKEQKKLLRRLKSTQSEVDRLRTAILEAPNDEPTKTQGVEKMDATVTGLAVVPPVTQESDREHARLTEKVASLEVEVRSLTSILEEKRRLEEDHARVQAKLVEAETEIQRLATALNESSRLNKSWDVFQLRLSDCASSESRHEINDTQLCLEDFLTQLLEREQKVKEQETELQSKIDALKEKVNLVEKNNKPGSLFKCAECDVFQTLVEQLRKERDEFRERCTAAQKKLQALQSVVEHQKKELDIVERNWKTKCQKSEKELADFQVKVAKLEEGTGWIVREKKALEERLSCTEAQVASLRESAQSTNTELEMTLHKLHLLQTKHQSDVAAFCGELSMKTDGQSKTSTFYRNCIEILGSRARTVELEKELKTLMSHPPPPPLAPAPMMQNEFANYVTSPYRAQSWSFPTTLQPPQQPSRHQWGGGPNKGQSR